MQVFFESLKTLKKMTDLGMAVANLGSVSAQTIAYRTAFMQHGAASSNWQQKEAHTMTMEKVDAAGQGAEVLWKGLNKINQSILKTATDSTARYSQIKPVTQPLDLMHIPVQLMQANQDAAMETLKLSNEIIDTLTKSIKPAHRYASGNADRLSVKKVR
jgi:hypothetical protein